jgi:hypothetical protein
MNDTTTRITEPEKFRGCWLEGHRGWTASGHLVDIAESYGMPLDDDDRAIVAAYLASAESVTLSTGEVLDDDGIRGAVIDQGELADRAEEWLNDNVAPEGWAFGWHDGEFYFWSASTWESDGIED